MSGINTLIDTVLHSVLGKRVDIQPPRDLNQPVRPLDPNSAPHAVRSDSRLNPRSSPLLELQAREGPESRGTAREQSQLPAAAPPSARASFSPAAQLIADVLARFPSPPSVLRTEGPLLAATLPSASAPPTSSALASQLRTSIGESGLFYESQLARWYRGEVPREQLERQPQMQFMRGSLADSAGASVRQTEATLRAMAQAQTDARGAQLTAANALAPQAPDAARMAERLAAYQQLPGSAQPAMTVTQQGAAAGPTGLAGGLDSADGRANEATQAPRAGGEEQARAIRAGDLPEPLQGLVRHQLELLASPVLRWEGDVWSGVFLALFVQVPEQARQQPPPDQDDSADGDDSADDEAPVWRSELALDVIGLGHVKINVHLQARRLRLVLQAEAPAVLARLEAGAAELQSRLQNSAGFADTHIRVSALTEGAGAQHGPQA